MSTVISTGDSGYPLEPWLMTPLPSQPEGSPKFRYNEALCKARNPIERLYGVLKSTWRCLSQQRTMLYDPGFAGKVVNACAVLHTVNLAAQRNWTEDELAEPESSGILVAQDAPSSTAKRIQERLIANFFT